MSRVNTRTLLEGHHNRVVGALTTGAEGSEFKKPSTSFSEALSAHPAVNKYSTLFTAWAGKGGEEE